MGHGDKERTKLQESITILRHNYKNSNHMALFDSASYNGDTFFSGDCLLWCQHMKHMDFDLDVSRRSSKPFKNHLMARCSEA